MSEANYVEAKIKAQHAFNLVAPNEATRVALAKEIAELENEPGGLTDRAALIVVLNAMVDGLRFSNWPR